MCCYSRPCDLVVLHPIRPGLLRWLPPRLSIRTRLFHIHNGVINTTRLSNFSYKSSKTLTRFTELKSIISPRIHLSNDRFTFFFEKVSKNFKHIEQYQKSMLIPLLYPGTIMPSPLEVAGRISPKIIVHVIAKKSRSSTSFLLGIRQRREPYKF